MVVETNKYVTQKGRNFEITADEMKAFLGMNFNIGINKFCLGNTSNDFNIDNMKEKGLKGVVNVFSVDYNAIDTNGILDIHGYLMKKA